MVNVALASVGRRKKRASSAEKNGEGRSSSHEAHKYQNADHDVVVKPDSQKHLLLGRQGQRQSRRTVGHPYYQHFALPVGLPLEHHVLVVDRVALLGERQVGRQHVRTVDGVLSVGPLLVPHVEDRPPVLPALGLLLREAGPADADREGEELLHFEGNHVEEAEVPRSQFQDLGVLADGFGRSEAGADEARLADAEVVERVAVGVLGTVLQKAAGLVDAQNRGQEENKSKDGISLSHAIVI